MHANDRADIAVARTGDIVAVAGLKDVITGETLCDEKNPIILERMEVTAGCMLLHPPCLAALACVKGFDQLCLSLWPHVGPCIGFPFKPSAHAALMRLLHLAGSKHAVSTS